MEFLLRHGYPLLFALVLAEQLGAPIPSTPVLLAMGALIGTGKYSWAGALSLSVVASMAADSAWYGLGRKQGTLRSKWLCRISLEPDSCVSSTRYWFKRLGGWALVIAKFVPGLSTVAPPMAGLVAHAVVEIPGRGRPGRLHLGGRFPAARTHVSRAVGRRGAVRGAAGRLADHRAGGRGWRCGSAGNIISGASSSEVCASRASSPKSLKLQLNDV